MAAGGERYRDLSTIVAAPALPVEAATVERRGQMAGVGRVPGLAVPVLQFYCYDMMIPAFAEIGLSDCPSFLDRPCAT